MPRNLRLTSRKRRPHNGLYAFAQDQFAQTQFRNNQWANLPTDRSIKMQLTEGHKALFLLLMLSPLLTPEGRADETCNSPYLSSLIHGQEDYLYVWTLGVKGMGDGFDKLVTLDVKPGSATYGRVIAQASVGERGEAHHAGFTDDRRFLWAGALDSNNIHIFDISADPAKPRLVRTITDLGAKSGLFGPHTFYALPGRMLVGTLSNVKDGGGVTGMALYNN
jgi:selenium-binding protein 1